MEVKINREIRDYTESVFFGMSLRQCIFAALACGVAVALYFTFEPYLGIEELSWICILGAAPFVGVGFIRWHSMTAEQALIAWVKSEILTPKHLVSRPQNLYFDALVIARKKKGTKPTKDTDAQSEPASSKPQTLLKALSPTTLKARLQARYLNTLSLLLEKANGKRDVHDKDPL